ncbi:MAG: peptidoglycan DD-metalloendopeptidase family protein [Nitrospirae bacterium]|nr:peptidoglycan DD-metalloendopeptidase family protein [Nitrospirota bacterium]
MKIAPAMPALIDRNIEALRGRKDPEALKAVAKEMESLFAYEMIKAMRNTADKTSGSSGFGKDTYMSMFDMEIARLFAERGTGLKEFLLKGMNRKDNNASETEGIKPLPPDLQPEKEESVTPALNSGTGAATEGRKPETLQNLDSPFPVHGKVSSGYGMRKHPVYGINRFHRGIDIAAAEGSDIYPVNSGKVIFSGEEAGYGNVVIIDHGDGLISKYAHNKANLVAYGDEVTRDTVIAQVGSTGLCTGPHLHFEVRQGGKSVDPLKTLAMK